MLWKYYIPHTWSSPEARTIWEDVWLMPAGGPPSGVSLWLTVDAILAEEPPELREFFDRVHEALREAGIEDSEPEEERVWHRWEDREFYLTPSLNMGIQVEDFDLPELLDWVKVFLKAWVGDPEPVLLEAEAEEFEGTNRHTEIIQEMFQRAVELEEPGGGEA